MPAAERTLTLASDAPFGRRHGLALLALVAVVVATWWPRLAGPIDLRWDGGAYYLIGTALANGEGYRLLSEPGSPPSVLHPPFLPLLVAAFQRLLGTDDPAVVGVALRMAMLAASLALAVATYALLARMLPRRFALAGTAIGVVQPQFVYFSDSLYAEPFFTLFAVVFLLLEGSRMRPGRPAFAAPLAWLAYFSRTAGIALLVAWIVDRWRRHGPRAGAAALLLALVPVLAWAAWIRSAESAPERREPAYAYQAAPFVYFNVSYGRNLLAFEDPFRPEAGPLTGAGFARRIGTNLAALPTQIGRAVSSWDAGAPVAWPLALLVALGLALLAGRGEWLMLGFVALSLAVICVTPFQKQFVRYLIPLFPILALALMTTLAAVERAAWPPLRALQRPTRVLLVWSGVALAGIPALVGTLELFRAHHDPVVYEGRDGEPVRYRLFHYAPAGTAYDGAVDWLRTHAAQSDVVAATDPQWVTLRTGRKAVLPPFEIDGREAQRLLDTVPVRYVVAETATSRAGLGPYQRYTSALLHANPERWQRVWESADGSMAVHARR